jgi:hypothetical protein
MPAKKTFLSARFRGPVRFDVVPTHGGKPLAVNREWLGVVQMDGEGEPSAVVLRNSLGADVVWSREDTGFIRGSCEGVFHPDTTFILSGQPDVGSVNCTVHVLGFVNLFARLFDLEGGNADPSDAALNGLCVWIFVKDVG